LEENLIKGTDAPPSISTDPEVVAGKSLLMRQHRLTEKL
jgi:hypothetical protein